MASACDKTEIYEKWHHYASERRVDDLLSLYDDNASFESPLVPIIMNKKIGMLTGKSEILAFLQEGTKRRPNDLVRWYRTGKYFIGGNTLIWEYPRETPDGNQIDILELMEIIDGKIIKHRIYWGWFGVNMLLSHSHS